MEAKSQGKGENNSGQIKTTQHTDLQKSAQQETYSCKHVKQKQKDFKSVTQLYNKKKVEKEV